VTNIAGTATSQIAVLVVDGRPVLVQQPDDQWAVDGESAQFTVSADGAGSLTFAWFHDGVELVDGGTVFGSRTPKLTLHDVDSSRAGNFSVQVSSEYGAVRSKAAKLHVAPGNDNLAGAIPMAALGGRVVGDNRSAGKETDEPNHAGDTGGSSVWYQWIPGASGMAILDTWGSMFDTLIAVYRGTNMAELVLVAASDDGMGFLGESEVSFQAEAGVTYSVAVDGYRGAEGQVVLNWYFEAPVFGSTTLDNQTIQFQMGAPARSVVVIEISSDLRHWRPVVTNMVLDVGLTGWVMPVTPGLQHEFFRAVGR
jgi:hypothetical protein